MMNSDERMVLAFLDEDGGYATGTVTSGVSFPGPTRQQASIRCRRVLLELKRLGYITELDDLKPVCWRRTESGTTALNDRKK